MVTIQSIPETAREGASRKSPNVVIHIYVLSLEDLGGRKTLGWKGLDRLSSIMRSSLIEMNNLDQRAGSVDEVSAFKPDNLSSVPWTRMVETGNQFFWVVH